MGYVIARFRCATPRKSPISPTDQDSFLADYLKEIEGAYPRQQDGKVLFPFLRQFVIAYRA